MAGLLRVAGHTVYAPTLDGCAERKHQLRAGISTESHGREIADLLFYEDLSDVALVGTSSGGMVVCAAAELARERINRLVFADALALFDGERVADILNRPPAVSDELSTGPSATDAQDRRFADLDPVTRAWALERYTMHPIAAMRDPVRMPTFWSQAWAATVVRCTNSVNPPEAHQRRTAEHLNAVRHELDTGHYPMLTAAKPLAALIAEG